MTAFLPPADEHARGSLLKQKQIDALVGDGIPPLALTQTALGLWSMVRFDRVLFTETTFEFARNLREPAGQGAFTFLLFDDAGEPFDIAAWRPPHVATWLGRAYALGQENAYQFRLERALAVHSSVTDWFRHERSGLFIFDYREAARALQNEVLGVGDDREARALRAKLTLPAPPIVVTRHVELAAA